jgi:prevent-host-death family protein
LRATKPWTSITLATTNYELYILYMATKRVSVAQLRKDLAELLRRVQGGDEVAVTRSGRLVATLVPAAWADLRSAGVCPPRQPGPIPRVRPLAKKLGLSLATSVVEERD